MSQVEPALAALTDLDESSNSKLLNRGGNSGKRPGGGVHGGAAEAPSVVFMKGLQGSAGEVQSRMWRPTSENWRLQRSERCRVDIPQRPEPQAGSLEAFITEGRILYVLLLLPF